MQEKLPKVFANRIGNASNNKKVFYSKLEQVEPNVSKNNPTGNKKIIEKYNLKDTVKKSEIRNKIIELFKSPNNVYKINVKIKIDGKTVTKSLIGRTNSKLITLDDELIEIDKIEDIELYK